MSFLRKKYASCKQAICTALSPQRRLPNLISTGFCVLLVLSAYLNSIIVFCGFFLFFGVLFFLVRRQRRFLQFLLAFLAPVFIIAFTSCLIALVDGYREFRPVVRDGYYLLQLVLYFCVGYCFVFSVGGFSKALRVLFVAGLIVALLNYLRLGALVVFGNPSFGRIRLVFIDGYPVVLLASFYAFDRFFAGSWKKMLFPLLVTFTAVVMTMSRMILITVIPFAIADLIFRLGSKKGLLLFSSLFIIFGCVVGALYLSGNEFVVEIMRKAMTSIEEMNPFQVWTEHTRALYWRGYELYASLSAFSSFNPFKMFFGQGFGYLIPIERTVLDGTITEAIPITHNAYGAYLCKFGIIGIGLYLFFFCCGLYLKKGRTALQKALLIALFFEFIVAAVVNQGPLSNSVSLPYLVTYGFLISSLENKRFLYGLSAPTDLFFEAKI